ncbi:MAG: hypothetical protein IKY86_04000 [Clostridia bacterium]|nr:hypothetical protein [Clostridia bacterium]
MKKKTMIAGAVFLILVLCLAIFLVKDLSFRVGRCIVTEDGRVLLLMESSPISLSDRTPLGTAFGRCRTGDLVLALHDGVMETFPGRTACYTMIRLGKGRSTDVPAIILNQLDEMGWIIRR